MVAKIESGKSIRGILHYNEDKVELGGAQLIMASGFAGDIERMNLLQKYNRFKALTELNGKSKINAMHISLNFDSTDKLDNAKLQQIAMAYMDKIGFGEQPFLVYRHLDSGHPHIHIATVLINRQGERMDIHNIGYKLSEPARKEIEMTFGLVKAEGREQSQKDELIKAVYGTKPTKQLISGIVRRVKREYAFASFTEFKAVLESYGVTADRGEEGSRMREKNGLQYSVIDKRGNPVGVPIKASSVYGKPTLINLESIYAKNKLKKTGLKNELISKLDAVLSAHPFLSEESFLKLLEKDKITVVYRKGEGERLFGITYIDQKNKTVFNGSELGKAYSAKAILERFERRGEKSQNLKHQIDNLAKPGLEIPYLKPQTQTNFLQLALAQTQQESGIKIPKRKKRKKGQQQTQEEQLTL